MNNIITQSEGLKEQIAIWRRQLHQIPELDLHLPMTSEFIRSVLQKLDIPFKTFPSHSGIVALIEGQNGGKTVGLRADMDALPIEEHADVPFASKNGNMHACGHDAHVAMLLGAASLLTNNRKDLYGNVKLIFQPGEEGSGGARRMIEDGILEAPHVDVLFGQHAGRLCPDLPAGHFGFYPGAFMASRDSFTISVRGKGCHGAVPAEGVDPIVVSAHIVTALQTLVSREINGTDSGVITIGAIHGGKVYNIIPETVEMRGAIRCLDEKTRSLLKQRVCDVCRGISETMRASCMVEYEDEGYPVTRNNPAETEFAARCAAGLFGDADVHLLQNPLMGSEDMSYYLNERPGTYWLISTTLPGSGNHANHSPYFTLDDSLLYRGAALMAYASLEWLKRNRS